MFLALVMALEKVAAVALTLDGALAMARQFLMRHI